MVTCPYHLWIMSGWLNKKDGQLLSHREILTFWECCWSEDKPCPPLSLYLQSKSCHHRKLPECSVVTFTKSVLAVSTLLVPPVPAKGFHNFEGCGETGWPLIYQIHLRVVFGDETNICLLLGSRPLISQLPHCKDGEMALWSPKKWMWRHQLALCILRCIPCEPRDLYISNLLYCSLT